MRAGQNRARLEWTGWWGLNCSLRRAGFGARLDCMESQRFGQVTAGIWEGLGIIRLWWCDGLRSDVDEVGKLERKLKSFEDSQSQ